MSHCPHGKHVSHLSHMRWLCHGVKIVNLWNLKRQKCNLAIITCKFSNLKVVHLFNILISHLLILSCSCFWVVFLAFLVLNLHFNKWNLFCFLQKKSILHARTFQSLLLTHDRLFAIIIISLSICHRPFRFVYKLVFR
jgi:hypothetical protein